MPSPDDPRGHGAALGERLQAAREAAATDIGGYDERRLIKIELTQAVTPEDIARASGNIEVVSQEEGTLVLAFASEAQLETFEAKLASLAAGQRPTYVNLLYALEDLDHWTPEDRTGWALGHDGFPDEEAFVIDVELWPLSRERDAVRLRETFEAWMGNYIPKSQNRLALLRPHDTLQSQWRRGGTWKTARDPARASARD